MLKYCTKATVGNVIAYLVDATGKSREEIVSIMEKHNGVYNKGVAGGSYAYYVGDKIAAAAGLEYRNGFDPDASDQDASDQDASDDDD